MDEFIAQCIDADRKSIPIGVGKMMLSSEDTEFYNIPHLHFLLTRDAEGGTEAINLEFGVVSSGESADEAVKGLTEVVIEFIHKNMSVHGFSALKEVVATRAMDEDWRHYRVMEFELAEQKRDLGHAFVNKIIDKVYDEFMEKYGIKASLKYNTLKEAA